MTFMRLIIDNDHFTKYEMEQIYKIQNECARIVARACKCISLEQLQNELAGNLCPNEDIHINLSCKLFNHQVRDYIFSESVVPRIGADSRQYDLRKADTLIVFMPEQFYASSLSCLRLFVTRTHYQQQLVALHLFKSVKILL